MRLLIYGAHINDINCINTPLAIAIFFDSIAIVKLLLKQSVNVDELDRIGFTPLQLLCRYHTLDKIKRKLRMLDLLLKHEVNLNKKTPRGNTSLTKMC
jgi:ankyrin repeat protein